MPLPDYIWNSPLFHRDINIAYDEDRLKNKESGTFYFYKDQNSQHGDFSVACVTMRTIKCYTVQDWYGRGQLIYQTNETEQRVTSFRNIKCLESGKLQLCENFEDQLIYNNLAHLVQSNPELKIPLLFEEALKAVNVPIPEKIVHHACFHLELVEELLKNKEQGYLFKKFARGYIVLVFKKNGILGYEYFQLFYSNNSKKILLKHCFGETYLGIFDNLDEIIKKFGLTDPILYKSALMDPLAYPQTTKDLNEEFFSYLGSASLLSASRVSKKWNQVAKHFFPHMFYQNTQQTAEKLMLAIWKASIENDTQEVSRFFKIAEDNDIDLKVQLRKSTILCDVLEYGNIKCLELLIDKGADVNFLDERKQRTPLMIAIQKLNIAAVRILLSCGSEVSAENIYYGYKYLNYIDFLQKMQYEIKKERRKDYEEIRSLVQSKYGIEQMEDYFFRWSGVPDFIAKYLYVSNQSCPELFRNYFYNSLIKGYYRRSDHFRRNIKTTPEKIDNLIAELIKLPEMLNINDPWFQWKIANLHVARENYEWAEHYYQKAKKLFQTSENPPPELQDILEQINMQMTHVKTLQENLPKTTSISHALS